MLVLIAGGRKHDGNGQDFCHVSHRAGEQNSRTAAQVGEKFDFSANKFFFVWIMQAFFHELLFMRYE